MAVCLLLLIFWIWFSGNHVRPQMCRYELNLKAFYLNSQMVMYIKLLIENIHALNIYRFASKKCYNNYLYCLNVIEIVYSLSYHCITLLWNWNSFKENITLTDIYTLLKTITFLNAFKRKFYRRSQKNDS